MSELDDTMLAVAATAPAGSRDPALTATAAGRRTSRPTIGLTAGQQLGHFKIERMLGAGGMGEVYLANDLALDRPVALKVLPSELAQDRTRRDRMVREARAQARITHPNVGHIYFIGEDEGRLYFAMEYVCGQTLSDRISAGPVPIEAALDVIRNAVLGLREAQRNGITHRDIKPSNLMVDGNGVLKVLDFGLAASAPGAIGDGPVEQTSLGGTPLYMAPEQARGEPVDFRADIYALGATLYHLVSGQPPFSADSVEQLLSLHASATRPTLPRKGKPRSAVVAIDALCARMMAPDPSDRFASYDELLQALETASTAHTRPAGFWARSIASAFDLVVLTIVVQLATLLVGNLTGHRFFLAPQLSAVVLLYMTICAARWARTPSMALFELEIVDVKTGQRPSWRGAIVRTLSLFAIPCALITTRSAIQANDNYVNLENFELGTILWVGAVAVSLIYAALRVPGKRTPWDRLSGTMVRYRPTRAERL
ncbi:MAG: protein kinase [Kofleriaceae bacterium]